MKNIVLPRFGRLWVSAFLTATFLYGCRESALAPSVEDRNETITAQPKIRSQADLDELNNALEETAKSLAISVKDVNVRRLIKTEVSKKFDGDYDVLFKTIAEQTVPNTTEKFRGKLAAAHLERISRSDKATAQAMSVSDAVVALDKLEAKVPNFQIIVPYYIVNKWDAETFIPWVVCMPNGLDKSTTQRAKAYDGNGEVHWIERAEYLKNPFPVIVLGINERTDENGNLIQGLIVPDLDNGGTKILGNDTQTSSTIKGLSGSTASETYTPPPTYHFIITQVQMSDQLFTASTNYDWWTTLELYCGHYLGGESEYQGKTFLIEEQANAGLQIFGPNYWTGIYYTPTVSPYWVFQPWSQWINCGRTLLTRSQPWSSALNIDFVDQDASQGGFFYDAHDLLEHQWTAGDTFIYPVEENTYIGVQNRLNFKAKWEYR